MSLWLLPLEQTKTPITQPFIFPKKFQILSVHLGIKIPTLNNYREVVIWLGMERLNALLNNKANRLTSKPHHQIPTSPSKLPTSQNFSGTFLSCPTLNIQIYYVRCSLFQTTAPPWIIRIRKLWFLLCSLKGALEREISSYRMWVYSSFCQLRFAKWFIGKSSSAQQYLLYCKCPMNPKGFVRTM